MSISARAVTKTFGDFVALDDVSIEVANGSLTALLGPSGRGTSTRPRRRPEGAPPRRAVRCARRARSHRAASVAAAAARRDADDDGDRDARPGGGDGGRRRGGGDEPRQGGAGRRPARPLRAARERV